MKLIRAITRPEKALRLKDSLSDSGYHGITTNECFGYEENKKTVKQVYRGKVYEQRIDAIKREELEFVVPDDKVENVVEIIREIAVTDHGADGRIYIFPMDESVHIHSGRQHCGDSSEMEKGNKF